MNEPIISVKDLRMHFPIRKGIFKHTVGHVKAVNGITFDIHKGETFGLVGESGCGKSTTGRCITRLLNPTDGQILYEGKTDIAQMKKGDLKPYRKNIQMIFQNPYASLNPRMTIREIIREPIEINMDLSKGEADKRVNDMLKMVGFDESYGRRYPHEFSGGQRQRIAIARALSINPKLVIADEAVSALDVSIQSQILNLFNELKKEFELTYLFISHNLSVVKHISDTIGVMYLGEMVELADKKTIFSRPMHPYTQVLLKSVPQPKVTTDKKRIVLKGDVPNPSNPPDGCYFHQRCPQAMSICSTKKPQYLELEKNHFVACNLYDGRCSHELTQGKKPEH